MQNTQGQQNGCELLRGKGKSTNNSKLYTIDAWARTDTKRCKAKTSEC